MQVSTERFEELVGEALDRVPPELLDMLENVVFLVEDEAPDGADLLGLYEGIPRTARTWADLALPDRIFIFRGPLSRMCADEHELAEEITVTVVHEIAHHFGIDDERLHALGWA